ncbi:MFS transporter [Pseudorhodoferax sp.]|uniref:MFS transporter n=1 Tax=Pseudorhodoferax sp. TaxID=1993553 RepID=UPI002DD63482|nr:MFS transporter [Pseudorhodoferax sp.]
MADAPDAPPPASAPPAAPATDLTIRATLRHRAFLALLVGGSVYFVGNAMQAMATAWLMVELTGSSFLAALVQTAVFLPMFLLALPAGVLADTTDRRRLIVVSLIVQAATVALLAALVLAGWAGAATLLFLTFVAGCCTALLSPPWNSTIVDVVPRHELPQAITAVGISYNAARALGPAAAGWVFVAAGSGWVFVLAVAGVLALLEAVRRYPPRPHPPSRLPAERLWGGMLSALRFARHSETVLAQLVRTVAYSAAGSALWALLPVIAQRQLGLGAAGFGFLIGCMGAGAVLTGLVIARLRGWLGMERLVMAGCVLYAMAMLVTAYTRWAWLVYSVLLVAGGCWMAVMSTLNTATQTSVPPWVRARATAMHTLCALGSFAIGSAVWGALSDIVGLPAALTLAALGMAAGVLLVRPFPLRMGALGEVTQVKTSENLFIVHEPDPEAGPVAVEIAYRIQPGAVDAFMEDVSLLRAPRRRDGATFWRVYRDLSDPARFVERFIVTSWADYLHQRARATLADQEIEARVRQHLLPGENTQIAHYVAER